MKNISLLLISAALALSSFARTANTDTPDAMLNQYPLFNGCFVESFVFVQKYKALYPNEVARVEEVMMNKWQAHSVAVFTYKGEWYVRDLAVGITRSHVSADKAVNAEELAPLMFAIYRDNKISPNFKLHMPEPPRSTKDKAGCVEYARQLVSGSKVYYVTHTEKYLFGKSVSRVPVLFWRDSSGRGLLYHPDFGTLVPHGKEVGLQTDDKEAVKDMVSCFGWKVDSVES